MAANTSAPNLRLIVGLGNPGREYVETRHNVGFMVLDRLAITAKAEFRPEKNWRSEFCRAGELFLAKPQTYMNLSGQAVRALSDFYKIAPEQALVVLDDMALPLGKLRLRPSGSAGGHNGLASVIEHLGTNSVPRLRVGIGDKPQPGAATGHVLGRFTLEERPELEQCLTRAVEAIQHVQRHGLPAAMNIYN
jgi:PTH1 family peptidyl-tRNA hydrolase